MKTINFYGLNTVGVVLFPDTGLVSVADFGFCEQFTVFELIYVLDATATSSYFDEPCFIHQVNET